MKRIVYVISLFAMGLTLYSINSSQQQNPINSNLHRPELSDSKLLQKYYGIVKSKKLQLNNPGHPDLFAQMHQEIRIGGSGQTYQANYQQVEREKALQRLPEGLHKQGLLPWTERGPGNVSGRTRAIVVDLAADPNANTWFAGAVSGGIWKTSNAGVTWQNLTPDISNLAISTMAQSQSNPDVLYAGTGEQGFFNLDGVWGSGIWMSSDRGVNWAQLASTAGNSDFRNVNRLVVDPANENIVVVCAQTASGSKILRTLNGGTTWQTEYSTSGLVQHIVANPLNFSTLYASEFGTAILKSSNGGDTWTQVFTDFDPSLSVWPSGRIELAVAPSDTARIYASFDQSSGTRYDLYRSENSGSSWTRIDDADGTNDPVLSGQGWYDNTIAVHPFNENIVYIGGVRLYHITVTGAQRVTTRITSSSEPHVDHHNLTIIPLNEQTNSFRIINGNDGGIWYTENDGVNWTSTLNGYNTTQFYGVDKRPGVNEYAGGMQDNGTWQSPPGSNASASTGYLFRIGGDGYDVVFNANNGNEWIGGFQFNGFYLTTDNGNNFTFIGDQVESGEGPFVSTLAHTKSNPELVLTVGPSGVFRSDDFGRIWNLIPIPDASWAFNGSIHTIEQSVANPQIVWAGSRMNSFSQPNGRIHLSTNGGVTFAPVNTQYTITTLPRITGIATHPFQDSTAYVLFSGANGPKVLRTTDLGQNWEDISGFNASSSSDRGFPDVAVYSLLVLPHQPNTLWAGTEIGLFESTDNGASWQYADNGLPAVSVWQMKVVDDQVVLATHGRGIWSVTIAELPPPPVVILPPSLSRPFQKPNGTLEIPLRLKQVYDSVTVSLNGQPWNSFITGLIGDTVLAYPVTQQDTVTISADGFVDGTSYTTSIFTVELLPVRDVQSAYATDFNSPNSDFFGDGFSIIQETGFSTAAIHSPHPYEDQTTLIYQLVVPIQVASSDAFLRFQNVALIEPGEAGTVFGDFAFWDFVVVEGTKDGVNWLPLVDGWDARLDSDWLNRYNQSGNGDESLYLLQSINLLDTFAPGDVIYIRFRLFADAASNGWGWAIDNLEIQGDVTSITGKLSLPATYYLDQNFPNPFNPETTIRFGIPTRGRVRIVIFNSLGQNVFTALDDDLTAGEHSVRFNASNLASGVYYYRLESAEFVQTQKMMVIK